jgi:stearoyl-CoA desaturase (delta-9 desaturase)
VVVLPALGTVAALAWPGAHHAPLRDGLTLAVLYVLTGLGITVGYHRLFTHKSFECAGWVRAAFAIFGSMALQGPVLRWVADHRRHHALSDLEGDPHSPVTGGFWHAHMTWLVTSEKARASVYARDLLADKQVRAIDRLYFVWMALTLALPFGVGLALGGTLEAGLSTMLWGGFVRIFLIHHVTWSVNSVCHVLGRQTYVSRDQSKNVGWLALPTLGESWHNNHHAFQSAAVHGMDRGQLDPSGAVIRLLARLGLATKVRMPSDKARATRRLDAPARAQGGELVRGLGDERAPEGDDERAPEAA